MITLRSHAVTQVENYVPFLPFKFKARFSHAGCVVTQLKAKGVTAKDVLGRGSACLKLPRAAF